MSCRLRAIRYPVDSETANRSGPAFRAVMRAENCSGIVSTEIPNTALHTVSRQYETFSRAATLAVDQMSTSTADADACALGVCPGLLSTILFALSPRSLQIGLLLVAWTYPVCG